MNVQHSLDRLNGLLPLAARQAQLEPSLRELHMKILRSFAERGRPPLPEELAAQLGDNGVAAALQRLAGDDLIVLAPDTCAIAGAYPFSIEPRPHRVTFNGNEVHAMCALDALSVAPMFDAPVRVRSHCHVNGAAIEIHMHGTQVLAAAPEQPYVGIRWQGTSGCAAQSLCLEMVFLRDRVTAGDWQGDSPGTTDVFSLPEAVEFGAAFFRPLLAEFR